MSDPRAVLYLFNTIGLESHQPIWEIKIKFGTWTKGLYEKPQFPNNYMDWLGELVRRLAHKMDCQTCMNFRLDCSIEGFCRMSSGIDTDPLPYINTNLKVVLGTGCYQAVFQGQAYEPIPALANLVAICKELGVEMCHE